MDDTKKVILPSLVKVDGRTVDSKSIAKTVRFVTQENELRRARGQTTPIDDYDYAPRAVERAKNH